MSGELTSENGTLDAEHLCRRIEEAEAIAGEEETLEGDVELGFGDEAFLYGVGEREVGACRSWCRCRLGCRRRGGVLVGRGVVGLASKKSSMAPQSEVTKPWKSQSPRRMSWRSILLAQAGCLIDGVVGAHDGVGFGFDDGGAEGGQVGVPEIVRGGVDVGRVASGSRGRCGPRSAWGWRWF